MRNNNKNNYVTLNSKKYLLNKILSFSVFITMLVKFFLINFIKNIFIY